MPQNQVRVYELRRENPPQTRTVVTDLENGVLYHKGNFFEVPEKRLLSSPKEALEEGRPMTRTEQIGCSKAYGVGEHVLVLNPTETERALRDVEFNMYIERSYLLDRTAYNQHKEKILELYEKRQDTLKKAQGEYNQAVEAARVIREKAFKAAPTVPSLEERLR